MWHKNVTIIIGYKDEHKPELQKEINLFLK